MPRHSRGRQRRFWEIARTYKRGSFERQAPAVTVGAPSCETTETTYSPPKQEVHAGNLGKPLPVFTVAPPFVLSARHAASAAFFIFALAAAVLADAGHRAAAQGRLEAQYTVSVAGIPIGRGSWTIEIANDQYTAAASGTTTGLIKFFTGAHGTGAAHGTIAAGQPIPTSYGETITYDRKVDDVRIALTGGNVTEYAVEPPLPPAPDRIPVTDADRRGVQDPMTSMLNRVTGTGDPVSPLACDRKVAVFDGRVRYDLHSEYKRMETVKADRGYVGPAVVCAVYFTPISGYVPSRPAIKYLVTLRDAEVWLAPIAGTRVLVPFRFSMPTPLGMGLLQATEFVSVAEPPRTAAKTQ
jgi:hypothetical protein